MRLYNLILGALSFLVAGCNETQAQIKQAPQRQGWVETVGIPNILQPIIVGNIESIAISSGDAKEFEGEIFRIGNPHHEFFVFNKRGDVVKHTYTITIIDGVEIEEPVEWSTIYKYDSKGYMTEMAKYYENNKLSNKTTFTYNSKGYLTEKAIYYYYSYDDSGNPIPSQDPEIHTFTHDSKGNIVEEKYYVREEVENYGESPVESQIKIIYQYDSNGNLISSSRYSDGRANDILTYKYDPQGRQIELKGDYICVRGKRDSKGNMVQVLEIDSDSSHKYILEHKYDSQGNVIQSIIYINDVPSRVIEYNIVYR